jgi:hypothetical protein
MGVYKYELPTHDHAFIGTWHIHEMSVWDADYLNLEVQAYVEVRPDNLGHFQFGLVSGQIDGYLDGSGEDQRFVFTWEGGDDTNPASGGGWMRLSGPGEIEGVIKLHLGDRSTFAARKAG